MTKDTSKMKYTPTVEIEEARLSLEFLLKHLESNDLDSAEDTLDVIYMHLGHVRGYISAEKS
jgi:hypothetical protein